MTQAADRSLTWAEFERVELRAGTIVSAETFPAAKKPAYILHVDFGDNIGIRKSSAQITGHYTPENLVGKQVLAVVNFPAKQVGPLMSECLVTGFHDADGDVVLAVPDKRVPDGTRLA